MTEDKMVGWYHLLSGHEMSRFQETVKGREARCGAINEVTRNQTQLSN